MARTTSLAVPVVVNAGSISLTHILDHHAAAAIFGIAVKAGSRNDPEGKDGLAHFVEHTIFKGTQRRASWHIINRMESVGGELNAYTTKEETVVYSIFPTGNTGRAVELIADLAYNSRFPERELEKERDVVLDEIDSYLDTPSEAVYDLFEEKMFAGTALSHNILGTEDSVQGLTGADCRKFLDDNYLNSNMTAFYIGPLRAERVAAIVERHFTKADAAATCKEEQKTTSTECHRFEIEENIGSHQSHTVLGIPVGGLFSKERYAVALFANIVGGPGMNSMLNIALREKRGLVYSVEAGTSILTDGGILEVYFGCDPEDRKKCIDICNKCFESIAERKALTPTALERAKKQYLGQLTVSSENRENRIMNAARSTLFRGAPVPEKETREAILAVSIDDIRNIAIRFENSSILSLVP